MPRRPIEWQLELLLAMVFDFMVAHGCRPSLANLLCRLIQISVQSNADVAERVEAFVARLCQGITVNQPMRTPRHVNEVLAGPTPTPGFVFTPPEQKKLGNKLKAGAEALQADDAFSIKGPGET